MGETTQDDTPSVAAQQKPHEIRDTYASLFRSDMMEELCSYTAEKYFAKGYVEHHDPGKYKSVFLVSKSAKWCPVMQNDQLSLALFEFNPKAESMEDAYVLMFYQDVQSISISERKAKSWGITVSAHALLIYVCRHACLSMITCIPAHPKNKLIC